MQVGLTEAAKLTGKGASTITRAANTGRVSYTTDDKGNRQFDVSELERAFGPLNAPPSSKPNDSGAAGADDGRLAALKEELHASEVRMLREQIRLLEAQIDDLKAERGKWQEQAGQITRLLTDQSDRQREAEIDHALPQPGNFEPDRRGGFLARIFGRR